MRIFKRKRKKMETHGRKLKLVKYMQKWAKIKVKSVHESTIMCHGAKISFSWRGRGLKVLSSEF
jgi:hypothetical protein